MDLPKLPVEQLENGGYVVGAMIDVEGLAGAAEHRA